MLKNKNQLDATYCFIVLLIGSTCFGQYYAHHQELTTIMLSFRSWFAVGRKLVAGRLEWCPGCRFLFFSYHKDARSNTHKSQNVLSNVINIHLVIRD